jgi:hypothetical protein
MKAISFSLYGNQPKYSEGVLSNLEIIRDLYPDWNAIVFCDWNIPALLVIKMRSLGAVVRIRDDSWHTNGMFWRFYAARDFTYSCVIFRDADSRINERDMAAVAEWLRSGKTLHIMRDHPNHLAPILGGMWGLRINERLPQLSFSKMLNFGNGIGQDQEFLAKFIYPALKTDVFVHDSFFWFESKTHQFPTQRNRGEYVGESLDEFGEYEESLRDQLLRIDRNFFLKAIVKIKSRIQAKFSF